MDNSFDRRTMLGSLAAVVAARPLLQGIDAPSVVVDVANAPEESRPFGTMRRYLQGPAGGLKSLLVSQTTLKAGQEPHPPHTHPEAEILIIADGRGEVSLRGKWSQLGPGGFLYAAPNDLHGVKNTGLSAMTYYVFRWLPI
jgi:quercetin dioxygenase-like cupin family protein